MRHGVVRRWSALVLPFTFLLPVCVRGQEVTAQAPSSAIVGVNVMRHPREEHLTRGKPFHGDVRTLPQVLPTRFERPEFEEPAVTPVPYPGAAAVGAAAVAQGGMATSAAAANLNAPAPSPSSSFEGLDFANWGAGHPPDTNGDVGPQHYIQTINTSVGMYRKNGVRLAAFTFNSLMSQGSFGNLCDTDNFGDPVVLYDTFEDRWIITDFAFKLDGSGNIIAPSYQCLAVSKSGDPVAGGWNFYSISSTSGFGDYPKFGIWPDGLYMSANMFGFGAGGSYQNVRVWAFNKAQMYAGEPTVQILSFDAPSAEFTLLPSNARLQTGTPPAGSPNYFAVVWQFLNAVSVYKFHVDWTSTSSSTFSGPFTSLTSTWWAQYLNSNATTVPSPANRLDSLYPRLMVQNQYTNLGGVESLWTSHTVGAGNPTSNVTSTQAAVRYYQVKVTGGSVEASATQSFTYSPDSTVFRFMPSVAVDRAGDMAIGYSASNATSNPAIRYAGRLAGDPLNAITQTEQSLLEGTGSQSGSCGGTCVRWGDYSAMALDVDGCTFWYTNLYYQTTGLSFNTRIGTFSFPGCTAVATGTLQGTVSALASSSPISGATVELGSRTATTDVNGNYNFTGLSSGVYPSVATSSPGYNSQTAANIVVSDGAITTQNFSLTLAPTSGCFTDTTQADFQAGVPTNCDLTTSPGDVILVNTANIDQQNTTLGNSGVGITTTTWGGQTFTPAVTGQLTRADINLFCSGCTGTTPDLTLSVRATSGGLPTGADLASATTTGFSNGSAVFYTANFSSPATLTSGTQYALVIRPTTNPSAGTYALTRSGTSTAGADVYAGGARVSGASSGTAWSIQTTGGVTTDAGFRTYMQAGFASSGTFDSSTKDANPAPGANVNWTTLSWTADTPAATAIQFQAASSNNADGPFNFVGPDGTAGTFFTNGGSLAQFTGQRYLKYQASLSTTSGAGTPTLHDVSVCFSDLGPTTLVVAAASGPVGGTADLSATLTSGATGVSGKSMSFKLNGNSAGSAMTDATGNATVAAVSLAGISAGSYPGAVTAAFAGDSVYGASSGSGTLTVQKLAQTITFGALASKTFGNPDFGVSTTASSGLAVTFAASGNCSVTGSTVHITGAGSCTITASQAGDGTYSPAANVQQSFSIAKAAQTITFGALANKTFGVPDFVVSATASSGLAVTFAASGNCTLTGSTVHISAAGSCTITASQAGDGNYNPAADLPRSFSILTSGVLPASGWRVLYVDSQETSCTNQAATNAIDGNPGTMWHTEWCTSAPATPHEIQIDLGASYTISGFQYLPRQDQYFNGNIRNYEFYVSTDGVNWGTPVSTGTLIASTSDKTQKQVTFTGAAGRYVRLRALTEVNGGPWTNVAELNVLGLVPTTLAVAAASGPVGGTADLSATLTSGATGVSGKSLSFKLNGNSVGSAMTDASGNATVAAVSLAGISAGSYPGAVTAAFAGDSVYGASSGSGTLTVQKLAQTITFGVLANKTFGDPDFGVSATASSGLAVTFAAGGNCSVTGSTVHITGAGSCTITASQAGDGTYSPAANVQQSFSIAKAAQTITFGALANKMLGDSDFTVSATASSGLAVTFAASGNCSVTGSTVHISGAGSCTVTASQAGDSNYNPAADVPRSFSILTSGVLPANGWRVLYVDSQETSCTNEAATNAIDGNPATMWHTQWCNSAPPTPHEIQIDLGANYTISGFQYLPRQDNYSAGNIANYEFYVSMDGVNWGTAVASGTLMTSASDHTQKQVTFAGTAGRYVRLRALTEVNGGPWTNVAELNVLGSAVTTSGPQVGSLTLSPASIAGGGTTSTATVTLTSAPLSYATVTLASSNTAATVPATVTVNAGATSANFTVTSASSVNATASSVINASYNGSTAAALLTVTPGASSAAPIPRSGWRVLYVDSQETSCANQPATNAIDGNPGTMWHTQWCTSAPATPHEIQIDLGASYTISGFQYLPRQDQYSNGNIRNYEFYISTDGVNWGTPVSTGTLITSTADKTQKQVTFPGMTGRYVRLRALTEVNGGPWTNAAEINVLGTAATSTIPSAGWRLLYVDSQETSCANEAATNAFDGIPATMWHTEWCHSAPATPHEIQIDLGASYSIIGFQYLPRQDQYFNGDIANYEFYVSADGVNWGNPASSGTLITNSADHSLKQVTFAGVNGRYVRFRALSEVKGGPWTSVAELYLLGSAVAASGPQVASVMLTPASIAAGGNTSTGSVTLTSAPLTDVSITLTSSSPGAATVPATATVSAGTITASFPVTSASDVSTTVTSVIGAALNGSNGTAILTVTPPSLTPVPQSGWRVLYVDSEATCGNGGAANAIDGNPGTAWFTEWCKSSPPTPHEIQIDLGASYTISGFQYLPRQDQYSNGNIANYEFYVSTDGVNWGTAVASGTLMTSASDHAQKQVTFAGTAGRYVRLRALTEVNGGPWTNVAELNVLGTPVWSGLLAPSRAINWSSAGVTGGIPNRTTVCATINPYVGSADAINTAIANCPSGQVVYLNAGIYHLSTGIVMHENVTLRGAGADQTFLVFTLSDVAICTIMPTDICFQNQPLDYGSNEVQPGGSKSATWTAGYGKGTTQITLSNIGSSGLSVGQYIFLDQANDIADNGSFFVCDATSPFACSAQGSSPGRTVGGVDRNQIQIVKITACTPSCTSGSTFTITPGLYAGNWSAAKNPGAWWMSPIQSAGLEDLSIDNSNNGAFTGGAVMLAGAMNCWIKGVRSISPGYYRNHVWLFQSAHNTVQDSYFYGVLGTSSYGVESGIASDDLIMNNIFHNVDTPLLAGTSEGDVYGYNFSINDNYSGAPSFLSPSADVHGAGSIYNLLEGNNGNGFRADVIQGTGGLNTLFRNRYNGWESGKTQSLNPIIINSYNRYENLIGNVLGQSGVQTAYQNSDVPIYDIGRRRLLRRHRDCRRFDRRFHHDALGKLRHREPSKSLLGVGSAERNWRLRQPRSGRRHPAAVVLSERKAELVGHHALAGGRPRCDRWGHPGYRWSRL